MSTSTLWMTWPSPDTLGVEAYNRGSVGSQEQQPVRYPERPQNGHDESTLEIVVRLDLLPLQQLLSCVNSRALDEVAVNRKCGRIRPAATVAWRSGSHRTCMGRL